MASLASIALPPDPEDAWATVREKWMVMYRRYMTTLGVTIWEDDDMTEHRLQGKRYADNTSAVAMEPGGYAYQDWTTPSHWQIRDPFGDIGSLRSHVIEVHDDGTITASPSIASPELPFHGWLKRGVWTW